MRRRRGIAAVWAAMLLGVLISFVVVACNPDGSMPHATSGPTSVPRP